jgi:hypothetical protein
MHKKMLRFNTENKNKNNCKSIQLSVQVCKNASHFISVSKIQKLTEQMETFPDNVKKTKHNLKKSLLRKFNYY